MNACYALLVASIPGLLLAAGLVPTRWANRHPQAMRRFVAGLTALVWALSLAAAGTLAWLGPLDVSLLQWPVAGPLGVGVYFDSLSAVMVLLISFVGWIIARYSVRYLDGEPTQGRFMRWISFTLGAVLLLVVANNLLMFTAAWMLTSFGLHQLLTHYSERPAALLTARKKFLISRLGDLLLVAALLLSWRVFGSLEYGEVFAAAESLRSAGGRGAWTVSLIGVLYVVGAMTKSAQFPFHSWLPDTMETPTPVSALMHAGIINAGGFLVIRLSPLVSLSPVALEFLALVGAFTALFGALVMLTQTSVKRSLAYSTMAQMGFMMLQCGLGAFSAALLHIVAHSLYKAHAFLRSGSVIDNARRLEGEPSPAVGGGRAAIALAGAAASAGAICAAVAWGFGIFARDKPGGLLLGMVLTIALTHLLWRAFTASSWRIAAGGLATAALISAGYYGAYSALDAILPHSVSHAAPAWTTTGKVLLAFVAAGFLGMFVLQASVVRHRPSRLLRSLYVHASNAFYFDIAAQKFTVWIWNSLSRAG